MGRWCFVTGQPPEVFRALSVIEREQFVEAAIAAKKDGW